MKRWIASMITIAVLGIGVPIFPAVAEDDNKFSVPVAFGRGLNTNQAGNSVNHVVIPNEIKTKLDGVVNFLVAGFHQVIVYKPETCAFSRRDVHLREGPIGSASPVEA